MAYVTDVLGEPYQATTIDLADDYEGPVVTTVVRRRASGNRRSDRGAVLHVHGYSDYFFQVATADFWVGLGLDFYAVDLRKCGRSLLPHQTHNFCRSLAEYAPDLEAAVELIRADGHTSVVLTGHSTGGLIAPLWLHHHNHTGRPVAEVDALVLNSPWLDLQGSLLQRTAGSRTFEEVGRRRPYVIVPHNVTGLYTESLHHELRGEWVFDLAWKPQDSIPVRAGWLRAVRRGHRTVQRGIDTGVPVLVLTSDRSSVPTEWSDAVTRTDVVLDVTQMARWSSHLGRRVTLIRVPGAMHDVLLSAKPVREQAFDELGRWLDYALR